MIFNYTKRFKKRLKAEMEERERWSDKAKRKKRSPKETERNETDGRARNVCRVKRKWRMKEPEMGRERMGNGA